MSESNIVARGRPRTRSMSVTRKSDPVPSTSASKDESVRLKIKGKSIIRRSNNKSQSSSRASSVDSDRFYDSNENQSDTESGLLPILKNLQFGTHTALRKTDEESRRNADRFIKRDSNKMLELALQQERAKMGTQIMSFLVEGSSLTNDSDFPQLCQHDADRPNCSQEEFDRTLKSLARSHPRFDGKSSELLYFLLELAELRKSNNLTDNQVQRILQNRLSGRLLVYFLAELKRDDVTSVVNRISQDFIEKVNTSDEVERYLNFKFTFKNLSSELTSLKQAISLAHPESSRLSLMQKYLERVVALLPFEPRHALLDDISRRQRLVDNGILETIYNDHELDGRILFHCRGLDKKVNKNVFKINSQETVDHESIPRKSSLEENSGVNKILAAINQITTKNNPQPEIRTFRSNIKGDGNPPGNFSGRPRPPFQQNQMPRENFGTTNFQKHFENPGTRHFEQQPQRQSFSSFRPTPPRIQNYENNGRQEQMKTPRNDLIQKEPVQLAKPSDPKYGNLIQEVKNSNYKFLGEKIRNDVRRSPQDFRDSLSQFRRAKPVTQNPYNWTNGRYSLNNCRPIDFPVFRKIGNRTPNLTFEALQHFSKCCHACGFETCEGKRSQNCVYHSKPDSWFLCSKCNRGFHLSGDCLAQLKN